MATTMSNQRQIVQQPSAGRAKLGYKLGKEEGEAFWLRGASGWCWPVGARSRRRKETMEQKPYVVWGPGEGLVLQSGPGRDLTFKVTGEDTNGAFDYFIVGVAPHGGPSLHVHHLQEEDDSCGKR